MARMLVGRRVGRPMGFRPMGTSGGQEAFCDAPMPDDPDVITAAMARHRIWSAALIGMLEDYTSLELRILRADTKVWGEPLWWDGSRDRHGGDLSDPTAPGSDDLTDRTKRVDGFDAGSRRSGDLTFIRTSLAGRTTDGFDGMVRRSPGVWILEFKNLSRGRPREHRQGLVKGWH